MIARPRIDARPMTEPFALEARRRVASATGTATRSRGVDLIARPGQLHGLLGPNGAGKTTLMRVAARTRPARRRHGSAARARASIRRAGRYPTASPASSKRPRSIHTCPDARTSRCSPASTATGNPAARDRVGEALEHVGLAPARGRRRGRLLRRNAPAPRPGGRAACDRRGCCSSTSRRARSTRRRARRSRARAASRGRRRRRRVQQPRHGRGRRALHRR